MGSEGNKLGVAGTLGGIAALITAIATLMTAYGAFSHSNPDPKVASHQESPSAPVNTEAPSTTSQPKPSQASRPATGAAANSKAAEAPRVDRGDVAAKPGFGPDINGYWTAVPQNPLKLPSMVFFFEVHGTKVTGTMRDPCKDDALAMIESGFYDGHDLQLRITGMPGVEVYAVVAETVGNRFEGSMGGNPQHDSSVVIKSGLIPCSNRGMKK